MMVKKAGGKVYGAVFTAAEKKAMEMEINRQIIEADRRYTDDIDAMVLYICGLPEMENTIISAMPMREVKFGIGVCNPLMRVERCQSCMKRYLPN